MDKKLTNDWNLCHETWQGIIDRYDENPTASDFTPRELVVVAVWTVSGIIGNGGFEYLFEGDLPGDPDYRLALSAFRTIGCEEAFSAFEDALGLFPGGVTPEDIDERVKAYQSNPAEVRVSLATRFWAADEKIVTKLAAYIRQEFMRNNEEQW